MTNNELSAVDRDSKSRPDGNRTERGKVSGKSVVVVGAGAAGLMTALELVGGGINQVCVLEASERVGGRIHSAPVGPTTWGNLGGEWINSEHRLVRDLAHRFGLELLPRSGFEAAVVRGAVITREQEWPEAASRALEALANDITDPTEPWNDPVLMDLDRRSIADFLDSLPIEPDVRLWLDAEVRGSYMVDPAELSLATLVLSALLDSADRADRFADGTAALTHAMAHALDGHVITEQRVIRIQQSAERVDVTTASGAVYSGDHVVLSTSLPAARRLELIPPISWPPIGQGTGGKLLIAYERRSWNEHPPQHSADLPASFVYETASHQPGPGGVLAAYSTTEFTITDCDEAFHRWFPHLPDPSGTTTAWWSNDPLFGCTYSARRPGELAGVAVMQQPIGRIHLAGEHTEVINGYIESALQSGRRAANHILATTRT